jgi:PmbA protein
MARPEMPGWFDMERVVREAEKISGGEAEVFATYGRTLLVDAKAGRLERATKREELVVGVRVAIGGRVGGAGGQVSGPGDVEDLIKAAASIAKNSPEDKAWPGFNPYVGRGAVPEGSYDEDTAEADADRVASLLAELVRGVEDSGARVSEASIYTSATLEVYANSHGGPLDSASTGFLAVAEAVYGEGTYYDYIDSTRIEETRLAEIASRIARRAREASEARGLDEPVRGFLLLEPREAGDMLGVLIEPALSAEAVIEGRSPLAGRLGERILSKALTIRDDPTLPYRPGSRCFDAEGYPANGRILFDTGILKAYLHTYYTSKRLPEGGGPGNAVRAQPWSRPVPGSSNLVVEVAGLKRGIDDLVSEIDRGAVVTATIGMWMSRPESGRLTATITHGYLVERGSIVRPIKGVSIMADVYKSLGEGFAAASGPVECRGSVCTPALLIGEVTLS